MIACERLFLIDLVYIANPFVNTNTSIISTGLLEQLDGLIKVLPVSTPSPNELAAYIHTLLLCEGILLDPSILDQIVQNDELITALLQQTTGADVDLRNIDSLLGVGEIDMDSNQLDLRRKLMRLEGVLSCFCDYSCAKENGLKSFSVVINPAATANNSVRTLLDAESALNKMLSSYVVSSPTGTDLEENVDVVMCSDELKQVSLSDVSLLQALDQLAGVTENISSLDLTFGVSDWDQFYVRRIKFDFDSELTPQKKLRSLLRTVSIIPCQRTTYVRSHH